MTDKEKLVIAEQSIKNMEGRIIKLEDQMLLCLKFMRVQAEKLAKEKNPLYKTHENPEA